MTIHYCVGSFPQYIHVIHCNPIHILKLLTVLLALQYVLSVGLIILLEVVATILAIVFRARIVS